MPKIALFDPPNKTQRMDGGDVCVHPIEPVVSVVNIGWAAVAWSAEAKGGQKKQSGNGGGLA